MLNLQLRVVNDNGTVNSATSRVLPTAEIVYTSAINTPSGLTFKVSRDDFVPAQFPFVVRVEQSVNGGAYAPTPQNSLFVVEKDSDDSKDVGKIVTYEAVGFVTWLVQGALHNWSSSAKNNARTWYEGNKGAASAGYTLHGMLTESKNAGWFPMLNWTFNGTRDSGGNNWVAADKTVTAWELSLNLTTILDQMTDDGLCEWTTSGTTLKLYRMGKMGVDLPDTVVGGRGFTSVPVRTDATGLYSHIRAIPDKLPWQNFTSDTTLRNRFGHRSIVLTQSGIESVAASAKNAQSYIQAGKEVVREESYDWVPTGDLPHPWVDFDLGDQITAHSRGGKQLRRVVALSVNQTGRDPAEVNLRVGKFIKSRAAKLKERLDSVAVGGIIGGSGAGMPLSPGPRNTIPAAPIGVRVTSNTAEWLEDGRALSSVTVDWDAVTAAEDGSEIDVVEYEVWSRAPYETLSRDIATRDTEVTISSWASGRDRLIAVRAKSDLGDWSDFSTEFLITPAIPVSIIPKAPEAVAATTNVGSWSATGPMSTIKLTITPVTESTDDIPITIKEYEIWVDGNPVMRTPTPSATLTQPAGAVRVYRARALSTLDVWGDLSPTLTVTGAIPPVAVRNPTAPVLTTGMGNVVARWDGSYVQAATLADMNIRAEARIGTSGAWIRQGTTLDAGGTFNIRLGSVGETIQVRFVAFDRLLRQTGVSSVTSITVEGVEFEDFDTASQNYILGIESKANEAVKSTVVQFAKNTSATTAPTSGWSGTRPSRGAGEHIWTRTLITYNDGTTSTTTPFSSTGDQGPQGVPGTPGANGATTYTWIRYADTASGGGISNNPTGKKYIGFAYNQTTATESDTPGVYKWSLIQGEQGVPGAPGANGQTTYTWVRYSANSNGSPIQTTPQATTKYVGIAVNKPTATPSSTPGDYSWSLFKGADGSDGTDGADGADGISVTSVVRYYRLGTSKPGQPSGASPSGWSTTEPEYMKWQNLYYADKVTYSDNTISWSTVQLSSAYTAAAEANAKADVLEAGQTVLERSVDGLNRRFTSLDAPKRGVFWQAGDSVEVYENLAPPIEGVDTWAEVRRNLCVNPFLTPGGDSIGNPNGATPTLTRFVSLPIPTPDGRTTGMRGFIPSGASPTTLLFSTYNLDGLDNNSGVDRSVGAWFLADAPGYSAYFRGSTPVALEPNEWKWVTTGDTPMAGDTWTTAYIAKIDGVAGASDSSYVTGVTSVAGAIPPEAPFDGSSLDFSVDPDMRQRWLGEPNASESVMEGERVVGSSSIRNSAEIIVSHRWPEMGLTARCIYLRPDSAPGGYLAANMPANGLVTGTVRAKSIDGANPHAGVNVAQLQDGTSPFSQVPMILRSELVGGGGEARGKAVRSTSLDQRIRVGTGENIGESLWFSNPGFYAGTLPDDTQQFHNGDEWHQLGWKPGETEGDPDRLVIEHVWTWNGQDWVHYDIWAENVFAANSVTARVVNMDEGFADKFWANEGNFGKIAVDHVTPNFGETINLNGNVSIQPIIDRQDEQDNHILGAQAAADSAQTSADQAASEASAAQAAITVLAQGRVLSAEQTLAALSGKIDAYENSFSFESDGLHIRESRTASAEMLLTSAGARLIADGAVVSEWNQGQFIVSQIVATGGQLGNHIIDSSLPGRTTFRAI